MSSTLARLLLGASLLFPLGARAQEAPPGDGPWVVRATFTERSQVHRLAAEIPPWEVHYDQGYVVLDVDSGGWALLLELGFRPEVDLARTALLDKPHLRLPGQTAGIPGFPCYRTVEETYAAAQALVGSHPDLAQWIDVGDTWEKVTAGGDPGYDMHVLRLTRLSLPGPKPILFVTSAIHAREYTTAETVTRFAESLVNGYGSDADATWILDHNELHLMLQANPDGRKKAETGLSWRKNTDNNFCTGSNSRGIDLNRNLPYQWACCGGSSATPCAETFHGPSAASEPEVQAVRDHARSIFPNYWPSGGPPSPPVPTTASGVYIDIHSSGQLVLWPWGYSASAGTAPNGTALQTMGRKFAYFNGHTPEQITELYPADGNTADFVYGERGVAAFAFELGTSFFQDCTSFQNNVLPGNLQALRYAARVARRPYEWPAGPDAVALTTVPAGSVNAGTPLTVDATLDGLRYNNSNGTEPTQNIAAGEVYVDTPPWMPGAVPFAMAPVDGAWDTRTEAARVVLATGSWSVGRHTLFVRGRDAALDWGPVSAIFVDVTTPVELQGFTLE